MSLTTLEQRAKTALFLLTAFFVFGALHLFYGVYLMSDTAIISMVFTGLCEIYSMNLGFTVYLAHQQFDRIQTLVYQEGGVLRNVRRFSEKLSPAANKPICSAVESYVTEGANAEWKAMDKGKRSRIAENAFSKIYDAVLLVEPQGEKDTTIFHHLMRMMENAGTFRYERIALGIGHIPRIMWRYVLWIMFVLLLLLALHTASTAIEIVVTAAFASVGFFGLWVVYDLDHPFSGGWSITTQPLLDVLEPESEYEDAAPDGITEL